MRNVPKLSTTALNAVKSTPGHTEVKNAIALNAPLPMVDYDFDSIVRM
ncbi:MAG: hypothetical protein ABF323_05160 [Lentimonas sp.]